MKMTKGRGAIILLCFTISVLIFLIIAGNARRTANNDAIKDAPAVKTEAVAEQEIPEDAALQAAAEYNMEKYADYRRLDEKFMDIDEDYVWTSGYLNNYLGRADDERLIRISGEELKNAKPGTVLAEGNYLGKESHLQDYVISVPVIGCGGQETRLFKDYGTVQIFSYYEVAGEDTCYRASCELYLYNKKFFDEDHDLLIDTKYAELYSSPVVIGPAPFFSIDVSSCDFMEQEELFSQKTYDGEWAHSYCGDDYYSYEFSENSRNVTFSKTSIDFGSSILSDFAEKAEVCGVLSRYTPAELYSKDGLEFDLKTLLNSSLGALNGKYEFQSGYNGYLFIRPHDGVVIAVKEDEILVGASARPLYSKSELSQNVETDKLFIGQYYKDRTKNPDKIQIKDEYIALTQDTLNQLLYLLMDSGTRWNDYTFIPDADGPY